MLSMVHLALYCGIGLWLLTGVGNWACRLMLSPTGLKDAVAGANSPAHSAGRVIGWLERMILAAGLLTGSWEILAAVIALKSVARFKELEQKLFAEYFLVGSLFSILWAILVTSAWIAYDRDAGLNLSAQIAAAAAK